MAANKNAKQMTGNSRRAEIFKELLPHINTNNYEHVDRYWAFGTSSVWEMFDDLSDSPKEDHSLDDAAIKLGSDAKLHSGKKDVDGRVSISQAPTFKTNALDGLSPEQRQILHEAFVKLLSESYGHTERSHTPRNVHDELDAAPAYLHSAISQ